ncbi:hypothetical protein GCM10010129_53940 [Streptomyces fumigatiscleroticus]|nr:hypothetical protein GCM10010129_53940 [Streptomyces fumigatiscleroticus]
MTTQNCAECGTRAEPGQSFCDACGAVLSWTTRAAARAAARSGDDTAATTPATAGVATADTPAAATPPATAPKPAAAPAQTAPEPPAPTADEPPAPAAAPAAGSAPTASAAPAPDETAPTEPVPAAVPGDTMTDRARSLLVPVADPEARPAAEPTVAPVLPGRPVADRPQVRAPGPDQGAVNGPPCPWCATPNRPDRHFCTRCAMPLATEDRSAERRPWWRRLFGRNGETPWAGDRPRLRRTFDRILTWFMAAVVLALLIFAGVQAPAAVQATRDHFAKRAPVAPDTVRASRSYPGHKPDLAFDKINNTWWGPGVAQSGEGQWIEASFAEPTRLLDLIITPGTSTRADQLSQSALPHRLKATITTKDGKTTTRELTLDQAAGGQRRAFRVGEVTKVRFTIESAYAASANKQVSIAEIEFFGRSSASSS